MGFITPGVDSTKPAPVATVRVTDRVPRILDDADVGAVIQLSRFGVTILFASSVDQAFNSEYINVN